MKKAITLSLFISCFMGVFAQQDLSWVSTFETVNLSKSDSFWNGSDESGGLLNGRAFYSNKFDTTYGVWSGFAVSNMTDTVTKGYKNQYSSFSGSGVNYSNNYAVVGTKGTVVLDTAGTVEGCYINNGTYPVISMSEGDGFAKKFGGNSGGDPDFFRIVATGYIGSDSNIVKFYLADYRFTDSTEDYIIKDWTYFDLSGLGDVDSITFSLESSDNGQYGMNTPGFFCLDNFNAKRFNDSYDISNYNFELIADDTFENGANYDGGFRIDQTVFNNNYNSAWKSWSGWSLSTMSDSSDGSFGNQYSCIAGRGAENSKGYLVGYENPSIHFPYSDKLEFQRLSVRFFQIQVNNTTYAYKTMKSGNNFAKKFGGDSGDDEDYLVLKARSVLYDGTFSDTISHYLADFRSSDNTKDYIQRDWQTFDLSQIILNMNIARIDFWIEGSDTGQYGLNTPAYFCADNMFPWNGTIANLKPEIELNLFPNPTTDRLYIDLDAKVDAIQIIDLTGKVYREFNELKTMVDVSSLANGTYFIRFKTDKGIVSKQFIKK